MSAEAVVSVACGCMALACAVKKYTDPAQGEVTVVNNPMAPTGLVMRRGETVVNNPMALEMRRGETVAPRTNPAGAPAVLVMGRGGTVDAPQEVWIVLEACDSRRVAAPAA